MDSISQSIPLTQLESDKQYPSLSFRVINDDSDPVSVLMSLLKSRTYDFSVRKTQGATEYVFSVPTIQLQPSSEPISGNHTDIVCDPAAHHGDNALYKILNSQYSPAPKNILKNFICAFHSYLALDSRSPNIQRKAESDDRQEVLQLLQNQIKQRSFTVSTLKRILMTPKTPGFMLQFLRKEAADWVRQGKMLNKEAHLRALQQLTQYVSTGRYLQKNIRFKYI